MNGLDLFSGIAGLSLALDPWVKTVAYCERDAYAQSVLLSRMAEGSLPLAPIWDDVQTLTGSMLPPIDIIFGGFPCQDISAAGRGAGLAGERSGLFFEIMRLVDELKPSFVFLENVPAIRTRGLHTVIEELSGRGYVCRWTCLSAQEVGANHKRERWFLLATDSDCSDLRIESGRRRGKIGQSSDVSRLDGEVSALANSDSERCEPRRSKREVRKRRDAAQRGDLANADGIGLEEQKLGSEQAKSRRANAATGANWWSIEPDVGRTIDGFSTWLDENKRVVETMKERIFQYADEAQIRPTEVLRTLLEGIASENVQQPARGSRSISPTEVLLACLLRIKEGGLDESRLQLESPKTPQGSVRSVRPHKEASSSPCRSKPRKQRTKEHPDSLQALSRFLAHDAEARWASYRWPDEETFLSYWGDGWEDGISRITHNLPFRVDRLKCLGNAVVPIQAREAFKRLAGIEK